MKIKYSTRIKYNFSYKIQFNLCTSQNLTPNGFGSEPKTVHQILINGRLKPKTVTLWLTTWSCQKEIWKQWKARNTLRKAKAIWSYCLSVLKQLSHTLWSAPADVITGIERDRRLLYSARPITFESDLRTHSLGKARHATVPKASEGCVADCLMSAEFPFFVQPCRMNLQPNT